VPNITGSGSVVSVGGIQVHSSIAGNLQRLLAAASASGISFGGGGYRDPSGQIAVRRNNCGSSNYAIYEMPASSCSPPTARPGSSMHEQGLAVDFTQGGSTLSRGSPGFQWLKANAAGYGFYNLPSEPWHWSTNGN
jgi:LAS superfamily LD-carboxypeptidase LdcB